MANPNNPFGFIAVKSLNGGDTFQTQTVRLASGYDTAIFSGDPVKLVSGKIEKAAATNAVYGIFVGVKYTDAKGEIQYTQNWPADTVTKGGVDAEARVISDKGVVFKAQFTGTPSVGSIGSSFTLDVTAGTADGRSGGGVTTTTSSGVVKLYDFIDDPANEIGQYAVGLFTLN
jgi:hypothetical protein